MSVARDNVMTGRMAFWLLAIGTAALAGSILLGVFGDRGAGQQSSGSNAYSVSAVGHAALVALLQAQDIPTEISRIPSAGRLPGRAVVVLAQPDPDAIDAPSLRAIINGNSRVLLVLPKWDTRASPTHPGWIAEARLMSQARLDRFAEIVAGGMTVVRPDEVGPWQGRLAGKGPLIDNLQLVRSTHLLPLIATDQGILLGLLRNTGSRVAVLSDPDLLTNAGLHRGANAAIVLSMIEDLRPAGGAVVFDETIHGFVHAETIWSFLLTPPWLGATLLAMLAAALTVWLAAVRFGSPVPEAPPMQAGKTSLVVNGASLLVHGGHLRDIARRYGAGTVADVAERLRIGSGRTDEEQRALLDDAARRRGLRTRLGGERSDPPLAAARHYHAWKREMLGGP
mgnify:CR=1 FL=1